MSKHRVFFTSTAEVWVNVDTNDLVEQGLEGEKLNEKIIERAWNEAPGDVCAHCSGWGQQAGISIGEIEPVDEEPVIKLED